MSTDDGSGRRYSEEEFALILRTASEVGEADSAAGSPGLTLSAIQQIAQEAGLDPRAVARAAAALPVEDRDIFSAIFGGPFRHRLDHTLPGEISEADLHRAVLAIRRVTEQQGESWDTSHSVEWTGTEGLNPIQMNVTSRDGETAIEVSGLSALVTFVAHVGAWLVSTVVGLSSLMLVGPGPGRELVSLSVLLGWMGVGFLLSRAFSKRWSAKLRRRLGAIMEEVVRTVERALDRGEPGPPALETGEGVDTAAQPDD